MNFSLHYFFLILYIFFKLIFPQIYKIFFKASTNDSCTRITREYNSQRYIANERLKYFESQGWDTTALRNGMARRRDDFEHYGYKKGCTGLNGNLGGSVHGRTQANYYNY